MGANEPLISTLTRKRSGDDSFVRFSLKSSPLPPLHCMAEGSKYGNKAPKRSKVSSGEPARDGGSNTMCGWLFLEEKGVIPYEGKNKNKRLTGRNTKATTNSFDVQT